MPNLTEFLLARIAEDEEHGRARLATFVAAHGNGALADEPRTPDHPARVLAECEAKRRIVESARDNTEAWEGGAPMMLPDDTACVLYLAAVYADHPDYREEWRPRARY